MRKGGGKGLVPKLQSCFFELVKYREEIIHIMEVVKAGDGGVNDYGSGGFRAVFINKFNTDF
nr:hypothetical protein [uncultured Acetatifactor sp.]